MKHLIILLVIVGFCCFMLGRCSNGESKESLEADINELKETVLQKEQNILDLKIENYDLKEENGRLKNDLAAIDPTYSVESTNSASSSTSSDSSTSVQVSSDSLEQPSSEPVVERPVKQPEKNESVAKQPAKTEQPAKSESVATEEPKITITSAFSCYYNGELIPLHGYLTKEKAQENAVKVSDPNKFSPVDIDFWGAEFTTCEFYDASNDSSLGAKADGQIFKAHFIFVNSSGTYTIKAVTDKGTYYTSVTF